MHPILFYHKLLEMYTILRKVNTVAMSDGDGFLRRWWSSAIRNWKRRKLVAALQALDDRVLREIGMCRKDIGRIVNAFDDRELGMVPLAATQSLTEQNQDAM